VNFHIVTTDVLVIGSGLAGSSAALKASEMGARVLLVSANSESASSWAQGGIVLPLVEDRNLLRRDILNAGCGINNPKVVDLIINEGEKIVRSFLIDQHGVPFDRNDNGELDLVREAAHSKERILHLKDRSGSGIMEALESSRKKSSIESRRGILIDLLVSDRHDHRPESIYRRSRCWGAYFLDPTSGHVFAVVAKSTVLATGGFSQLFHHSTGPQGSVGDGISAAHRAGAKTLHLEYVQFHPTALFIPNERRYLLTEALRGAGGKLLNHQQQPFIDELAPRDIVSRAIHNEMLKENGEHVWLDLRLVKDMEDRFPTITALLKKFGFRPDEDLIPVVPAAHYTIGGVWSDTDARSSLHGLWVAGEVACTGLHGANRLASTSLLESVVFGYRAGEDAVKSSRDTTIDFVPREWLPSKEKVDPALLRLDWSVLKRTLWNYVGLVRTPARLQRAERILLDLRKDVESFYRAAELSESLISLRHAALVSTLLLYSAIRNRSSIGTHYLRDSEGA
jgi:L-aspartate oxidase